MDPQRSEFRVWTFGCPEIYTLRPPARLWKSDAVRFKLPGPLASLILFSPAALYLTHSAPDRYHAWNCLAVVSPLGL